MKYWTKVKVTSWFYEGIEGTAIREKFLWLEPIDWKIKFLTDITVKLEIKWDEHEIVFPNSSLEIIK